MCLADTATHLPCPLETQQNCKDDCLGGYSGATYVRKQIFFFKYEVNNLEDNRPRAWTFSETDT